MKEHKKHGQHPHDKMAAMSQFNDGHWEKRPGDVETANLKYGSEFGQGEAYKRSVDDLSNYVKKHRMKY